MRKRVVTLPKFTKKPKLNLMQTLMDIFQNADKPLVIREIYSECFKKHQWADRSIRMYVEGLVSTGTVVALKCPCGHSHLYVLKSKKKQICMKDMNFKYTL